MSAPSHFAYANQTVTWDGVPDSDLYDIQFTIDSPIAWRNLCETKNTYFGVTLSSGTYLFKGRRRKGDVWDAYGADETVVVV